MIRNCQNYHLNIHKIFFGDCSYLTIFFNKINFIIPYYDISAIKNLRYKKSGRISIVAEPDPNDSYLIDNVMQNFSSNFREEGLYS